MKIKQVLNSVNTKQIRRLLRDLYHRKGPGRKPYNPLAMLKAQLLKHLLRIPSDRRLALRLKHDKRIAKACGFKKHTPSHGLFTHFRHRLGQDTYKRIFNQLLRRLLEAGTVKGDVIAVDSTHLDAYSQRAPDNRTGKSDPEARVGRGKRGFILGYRVHTACCAESEMPLAFTVAPCNENDKVYFKPLLERVHALGVKFRAVLADAQYNSAKVRETARAYGAEPVIPVRRDWVAIAKYKKNIHGDLAIWQLMAGRELGKFRRVLREIIDDVGVEQVLFASDAPCFEPLVSNSSAG